MKTNSANFEQDVLKSTQPVLVDFFATWCGPCKMLAPALDKLQEHYQGRAKIMKVDIDESMDLAERFGITAVPTLLIFQNGKAVNKFTGLASMKELTGMLDKAITATA